MKLYYFPGACSLSPHIVLLELGLPLYTGKNRFTTKKTASGVDYPPSIPRAPYRAGIR